MIEMGIFKIFKCFSTIYKKGEIYKVDKMRERAEHWPTPTLILKIDDEKLFHW